MVRCDKAMRRSKEKPVPYIGKPWRCNGQCKTCHVWWQFVRAAQEVKDLNEDEICEIFETANRYAAYLDDNLIKIKDVQRVIEKKSGVN